jgi:lipopolysaccharide/colanic/teichoic acid biosynthesis glycosyltransferase
LNQRDSMIKRLFDIWVSLFGLFFLFPIIFASWFLATLELKQNGLFLQTRIGRNGLPFKVMKIKTMHFVQGASSTITSSGDSRISATGSFFRRTKIDELPQLLNVLLGDMSLVGPRPDVPGYADQLEGEDRKILLLRPGITGPAQLYFKNEEMLLAEQKDPVWYNDMVIWPKKVAINREYLEHFSFAKDFYFIIKTVF